MYGKNEIKLSDDTNIKKMISYDNYIYYIAGDSIYRVMKDGTERTEIYTEPGLDITNFNVKDGFLYYSAYNSDSTYYDIYKIKLDSSVKSLLVEGIPNCPNINIISNYIYFTSPNILRNKATWYKCNVDGSNLLPINLDVGIYK